MIDKSAFAALQKKTANSFFQQKKLLKNLLAGKSVQCETCANSLFFKTKNEQKTIEVYCEKGCTNIQLDME